MTEKRGKLEQCDRGLMRSSCYCDPRLMELPA